eukprot:UN31034
MGSIFRWLRQPVEASLYAGETLRIFIISFIPQCTFQILQRFLWCQGILNPIVLITFIIACFHPILLYFSLQYFGFIGFAYAITLSICLLCLISVLYIVIWHPQHRYTWTGFDFKEAIQCERLVDFMKIAVPGFLQMSEWWFWEVVCFLWVL